MVCDRTGTLFVAQSVAFVQRGQYVDRQLLQAPVTSGPLTTAGLGLSVSSREIRPVVVGMMQRWRPLISIRYRRSCANG
jgi:hypothetical protein